MPGRSFISEDGRSYALSTIELGAESDSTWIEILPERTVNHPKYGKIETTSEDIDKYVNHFAAGIPASEIDLDYSHKGDVAKGNKAAGWIKSLEKRPASSGKGSALWGLVDLTPTAAEEVRNKEWRYVSAEIRRDWTNPVDNKKYDQVIFGAGLTNRPFMRGMAPVTLSDDETVEQLSYEDAEAFDPTTPVSENYLVSLDDEFFTTALKFRDITQKQRKDIPSEDFAGKGTSFPIEKPEDVASAAALIGRAGTENYSADVIKANIIRIAKRKGAAFVAKLPKAWKLDDSNEEVKVDRKKLIELLKLSEDATDEQITAAIAKLQVDPVKVEEEKKRKFEEDYPEEAAKLKLAEANETKRVEKERRQDSELAVRKLNEAGIPPKFNAELAAHLRGDTTYTFDDKGTEKEGTTRSLPELLADIAKTGIVKFGHTDKEGYESEERQFDDPREEMESLTKQYLEEHKDEEGLDYRKARAIVAEENPDLAREANSVKVNK